MDQLLELYVYFYTKDVHSSSSESDRISIVGISSSSSESFVVATVGAGGAAVAGFAGATAPCIMLGVAVHADETADATTGTGAFVAVRSEADLTILAGGSGAAVGMGAGAAAGIKGAAAGTKSIVLGSDIGGSTAIASPFDCNGT